MEKEKCLLCGQEVYEPLLSGYRPMKLQFLRMEKMIELEESFFANHSVMSCEDWDNLLLEAAKVS